MVPPHRAGPAYASTGRAFRPALAYFHSERTGAHVRPHDHRMADSEAMCTVVVSLAPEAPVPLLLLGVRDEFTGRPWQRPARHWPGSALIGGLDEQAGGTWLAVHPEQSRVGCILNGRGEFAPPDRRRSRGELPLRAAAEGQAALKELYQAPETLARYDPFYLVCADLSSVLLLGWDGVERRPDRARTGHPRADQRRPHVPAGPRQPAQAAGREGRPVRPEVRRAPPVRRPGPPRSPTPGATGSPWPRVTACPPPNPAPSSSAASCPTAASTAARRSPWSRWARTAASATTSSPTRKQAGTWYPVETA